MAHPFGGSPTQNEYLQWAYSHGCRSKSGYRTNPDGKICAILSLQMPGGKRMVVPAMLASERLSPTQVSNMDRRLG